MTKRYIAFLLSMVLLLSCLPYGVFAQQSAAVPAAEEESSPAALCVESTWCNAGRSAEVRIVILDNPGIAGAKFSITFDDRLTLIGAKEGTAFAELDYTAPASMASPCPFNWDSLDAESSLDGTVLTLTFSVSESVEVGDELEIGISYVYGDIYDAKLNSLQIVTVNGTLTVIDFMPGDVNGDGTVNGKDVTLIRRYNAGIDEGVHLLAADVNNDGTINGKDVTQIRRYNAGWDVVLMPGEPVCEHVLTAVAEKEPTCTESGNVAYWQCSLCEKCFRDEGATDELSARDVALTPNGHNEVIDPAKASTYEETGLTEGSHCETCGETLIKQEVIPVLTPTYYSITYNNLFGAEYPTLTQYASHRGVSANDMPKPERPGYNFVGWFTASIGGEIVDYIPENTAKNITLFARWEAISYKIFYAECGVHDNPEEYTTENEIYLKDPKWSGLVFLGWTDENGNYVQKIEKGTIGNLTLKANWSTTAIL